MLEHVLFRWHMPVFALTAKTGKAFHCEIVFFVYADLVTTALELHPRESGTHTATQREGGDEEKETLQRGLRMAWHGPKSGPISNQSTAYARKWRDLARECSLFSPQPF